MISKRLVLAVCCLALCLGVLVWVAPAQARFLEPSPVQYQTPETQSQNMNVLPLNQGGVCVPASVGEGSQIKVFEPIDQTVIYLQCGHVVSKILATGGCRCGGVGNWHYTTDCPHKPPLYINLPCPRR